MKGKRVKEVDINTKVDERSRDRERERDQV